MGKSTKILYAAVKISGILGKIVPEIKVVIPESCVYAVTKRAAKAAIREELDQRCNNSRQACSECAASPVLDEAVN